MIKLIPNSPLDNMVTLEKGGKALMEKSYDENSDELTIKPGLSPQKLKDAIFRVKEPDESDLEARLKEIISITQKENDLIVAGGRCKKFIGRDISIKDDYASYAEDWTVFYEYYAGIKLSLIEKYGQVVSDSMICDKSFHKEDLSINIMEWLYEQKRRIESFNGDLNNLRLDATNIFTSFQYELLTDVGFDWSDEGPLSDLSPWDKMYLEMKKFKVNNGHCFVPTNHNEKLRHWAIRMRQLYGADKLENDKCKKLEEIGFSWNIDLDKIFKIKTTAVEETMIHLENLEIPSYQRQHNGNEIRAMGEQLKDHGQIVSLLIHEDNTKNSKEKIRKKRYKVLDGSLRVIAAKKLGWKTLMCKIVDYKKTSEKDIRNIDQLIYSLQSYKSHLSANAPELLIAKYSQARDAEDVSEDDKDYYDYIHNMEKELIYIDKRIRDFGIFQQTLSRTKDNTKKQKSEKVIFIETAKKINNLVKKFTDNTKELEICREKIQNLMLEYDHIAFDNFKTTMDDGFELEIPGYIGSKEMLHDLRNRITHLAADAKFLIWRLELNRTEFTLYDDIK